MPRTEIRSEQVRNDSLLSEDIKDGTVQEIDLHPDLVSKLNSAGGFPFEIIIGQVLINQYQQMPVFGMCDIQGELQIDGSFILEI